MNDEAIVSDWGIATHSTEAVRGFSGKLLFAPRYVLRKDPQSEHVGSLAFDLESLFYTAVCISFGDASWARESANVDKMVRDRHRRCFRDSYAPGWENLRNVARAFPENLDDDIDGGKLLMAFRSLSH
jgi:hypothetical protein